jgi:hypothetical protein
MAELKDDCGVGGGENRATVPSETIAELGGEVGRRADRLEKVSRSIAAALIGRELSRKASRYEEISRSIAASMESSDRISDIETEIERLLEGFDDRLSVVNRRLDRVLDRRA